VKESELKEHEMLLGIETITSWPAVDVLSYSPHNQIWTTFMPNITEYVSGEDPTMFYTAYCSITEVFYVLVDDNINGTKLIAVDIRRRKVKGQMNFDFQRPLISPHCDEKTGDLIGVLWERPTFNGILVKINFEARKTTTLFLPVQVPFYNPTAFDMSRKRWFQTHYECGGGECGNYTVITDDFKSIESDESPIFTNYSIDGLFYEDSQKRLYGFLQTPETSTRGPNYKAQIGVMDLISGTFKSASNVWPGDGAYSDVCMTLDPKKRLMYIQLDGKLITLSLRSGKTIHVDEQNQGAMLIHFARFYSRQKTIS